MSINSLTEIEVRRVAGRQNATISAVGGGATPAPPNNALSALVKYIPTESVTLYVAAVSAAPALKAVWPGLSENDIYWFFGVLTPVIFVLVFIGKLRVEGLWPLRSLKDWPWWKTFAATLAFFVWALAVPGPPDIERDTSGTIAALLALLVSTLLSLLEPVFDRAPSTSNGVNPNPASDPV